jgi:hypothetical protein
LIGFALGGEAGKRLVLGMGLSTSPDTLLGLIHAQQERPRPTPRVLEVDDFSICSRKSYGTILIDLEKRVPVDLLPDREGETLAKWLREHSGVEIMSRDRGGPYADGARQGAPQAQQVADRWHLLSNLSEVMKGFFLNKKAQLNALVHKPSQEISEQEASQLSPWYAGMALSKRKAGKECSPSSRAGGTISQDTRSRCQKGRHRDHCPTGWHQPPKCLFLPEND